MYLVSCLTKVFILGKLPYPVALDQLKGVYRYEINKNMTHCFTKPTRLVTQSSWATQGVTQAA